MAGYIRANSAWRTLQKGFVYANGTWRTVQKGFLYANGAWRQFFSSAVIPTIATQVTISKSGSGLITLTGTNYRWTNYSTGDYYFERSTDSVSWTQIDTGSILNPAVGGSNTKTYVLTQSDVTANITNYFRFKVIVTSSTGNSGTSVSSNTTVQGPGNITDLSSSSVTTTSVALSWTASLGAGSQVVQYKASSSGTWLTYSTETGAATSVTVSSLTANTSYDFRIIPYTGTAANGYYGNPSNVYTVSTTALKPPNVPTGLSASGIQTTYLTFSWTAPTTDSSHNAASYYYYDYNTTGITPTSGYLSFSTSVTLAAGTLAAGTTYYLWVQAYNSDGGSSWVYTTATTQSAVIIPGQVTGLTHTKSYSLYSFETTLTRNSSTQKTQDWYYTVLVPYALSWNAPANAVSYEISWNSVNSNPGVGYWTTTNTSYTDTEFQNNRDTTTNYYWVRAISSTGNAGAWSSVTGGTSTATVVSGSWALTLWRCSGTTSTSGTQTNTAMSNIWTGVNSSFTHYATISGTIAGTFASRTSSGCV